MQYVGEEIGKLLGGTRVDVKQRLLALLAGCFGASPQHRCGKTLLSCYTHIAILNIL
jgi:hypothetical protein